MKITKFINKINESIKQKNRTAVVHFNFFTLNVLKCLKRNNFIKDYAVVVLGKESKIKIDFIINNITKFNYIKNIELISKKSNKIYLKYLSIYKKINTYNELILSTSSGIKTGSEAINSRIGGESLFKIVI